MIFGTELPIIKYTKSGQTKYINFNLDINGVRPMVKVEYEFNIPDLIEHTSVFSGRKKTIVKGYRTKITINLLNMTSFMWNHNNTFQEGCLFELAGLDECYVAIHGDEGNAASEYVNFNILRVSPYYYDNINWLDACLIELETREWFNIDLID